MTDLPNTPPPDELNAVREQIKALRSRESELRRLLIDNPDLREGAGWLAEIKTVTTKRVDIQELRDCNPDLVAEFTFPEQSTRVELIAITEDGGTGQRPQDAERIMSDDRLVIELRAQLQGTMEENQELRVQIAQRDRWITELRSTVAAFTGNHFTLSGKPSENTRRRG